MFQIKPRSNWWHLPLILADSCPGRQAGRGRGGSGRDGAAPFLPPQNQAVLSAPREGRAQSWPEKPSLSLCFLDAELFSRNVYLHHLRRHFLDL